MSKVQEMKTMSRVPLLLRIIDGNKGLSSSYIVHVHLQKRKFIATCYIKFDTKNDKDHCIDFEKKTFDSYDKFEIWLNTQEAK